MEPKAGRPSETTEQKPTRAQKGRHGGSAYSSGEPKHDLASRFTSSPSSGAFKRDNA
ncbi:hypothetical protein SAMD00023353_1900470 [Rosellinia necatrix]|uniref:Uncharacterized protein n=1 Tax=Rosellinia necatrix TaxID=77044 RepID=A0A1S8A7X6_ROSNE|nr:hypothetical protein SAMD00023353_1900470 [Rosellinia necatrix]